MKTLIVTAIKSSFVFLILVCMTVTPVLAQSQDDTIRISADQVINHDYAAAGGQIIMAGTINGDAYIAGGDVEIDGTVNGDLLIAGGNVTIKGVVAQDVRAAGGSVRLEGKVGRNVSIVGGSLKVTGTEPIGGNVWIAGGNISYDKPTLHDLNIAGGDVYIDAPVRGSINGQIGELSVGDNLSVGGDVNYRAKAQAPIPPEASISGKVNYAPIPVKESEQRFIGDMTRGAFYFSLYTNLVLFLVMIALWKLLPSYSHKVVETMTTRPWLSVLIGFLTWLILPFVVVILMITVVGIPLAALFVVAGIIAYFISTGYVAVWIGQRILSNFGYHESLPTSLLTGLIVLFVLGMIPLINVVVFFAISLWGVGALMRSKYDVFLKLRHENVL